MTSLNPDLVLRDDSLTWEWREPNSYHPGDAGLISLTSLVINAMFRDASATILLLRLTCLATVRVHSEPKLARFQG
jgi:hypothetical protein